MRVVTGKEMSRIERFAYKDGYLEKDFMEKAGKGIAHHIHSFIAHRGLSKQVTLLGAKGNNTGDGYVALCHLRQIGYSCSVIQLHPLDECSALCQENARRFQKMGGQITFLHSQADLFQFPKPDGVIVDGLFGTGFRGKAKGMHAVVIRWANLSGLPIFAIDIPSGLNSISGTIEGDCIRAKDTIFLGLPKQGFFLREGWNMVGRLRYVDFGLPSSYIEKAKHQFTLLTQQMMVALLPPIKRNRHKYQAGSVIGIGGSPGMPGAPVLTSYASLRTGAGVVRLLHPDSMNGEFSFAPPEIIRQPYQLKTLETTLEQINHSAAAFVGPGMGQSKEAEDVVERILRDVHVPLVIDADALNLISKNNWSFPPSAVLTPHIGEMRRLLGLQEQIELGEEFLTLCHNYAREKQVTLLLKGGPSFIFTPDHPAFINPHGHPGMATAGSGDVLTGVVASFLAQGLSPQDAACLGSFVHGLSGELAVRDKTAYGVIASDLIEYMPKAFDQLLRQDLLL